MNETLYNAVSCSVHSFKVDLEVKVLSLEWTLKIP